MTKRRYFVRVAGYVHGLKTYDVIDRDTGKSVFSSLFESRAVERRNKLNKTVPAYPGGTNRGFKS